MTQRREPDLPRVLVVEDDDELRWAISSCLAREGYDVRLVANGAEAVRAALGRRPDVMLIDVMLPDSGGLGVANEIRRHPDLGAVPVLFMTGMDSPALHDRLAPDPVLLKPFRHRQLVSAVSRVAGRPDDARPALPPS